MAKKHSKRTLRTLFNYYFRASEGGNKVVHVEQTNYTPEPQTAVCRNMWNTRPRRITPSSISTLHMTLSLIH